MRGVGRARLQRGVQYLLFQFGRSYAPRSFPRLTSLNRVEPLSGEGGTHSDHGGTGQAGLIRNQIIRDSLGSQEDDPTFPRHGLRRRPSTRERFQGLFLSRIKSEGRRRSEHVSLDHVRAFDCK